MKYVVVYLIDFSLEKNTLFTCNTVFLASCIPTFNTVTYLWPSYSTLSPTQLILSLSLCRGQLLLFTFQVPYFNGGLGILPQDGRDMWHKNFVKMPCSTSSTITKSGFMVRLRTFLLLLQYSRVCAQYKQWFSGHSPPAPCWGGVWSPSSWKLWRTRRTWLLEMWRHVSSCGTLTFSHYTCNV